MLRKMAKLMSQKMKYLTKNLITPNDLLFKNTPHPSHCLQANIKRI